MLEYGLTNPNMDNELELYYREKHPSWKDKKILEKMNQDKKKFTFFNEKNNKKNSTKKPKKEHPNKPKKDKPKKDKLDKDNAVVKTVLPFKSNKPKKDR